MSALLTFSRKNEHRAHVKEVNAGLPPRACDFRMPPAAARRQASTALSAQGALRSRILIHDVKERVPQICGHFDYGNKQRTRQEQNLPLCRPPPPWRSSARVRIEAMTFAGKLTPTSKTSLTLTPKDPSIRPSGRAGEMSEFSAVSPEFPHQNFHCDPESL